MSLFDESSNKMEATEEAPVTPTNTALISPLAHGVDDPAPSATVSSDRDNGVESKDNDASDSDEDKAGDADEDGVGDSDSDEDEDEGDGDGDGDADSTATSVDDDANENEDEVQKDHPLLPPNWTLGEQLPLTDVLKKHMRTLLNMLAKLKPLSGSVVSTKDMGKLRDFALHQQMQFILTEAINCTTLGELAETSDNFHKMHDKDIERLDTLLAPLMAEEDYGDLQFSDIMQRLSDEFNRLIDACVAAAMLEAFRDKYRAYVRVFPDGSPAEQEITRVYREAIEAVPSTLASIHACDPSLHTCPSTAVEAAVDFMVSLQVSSVNLLHAVDRALLMHAGGDSSSGGGDGGPTDASVSRSDGSSSSKK